MYKFFLLLIISSFGSVFAAEISDDSKDNPTEDGPVLAFELTGLDEEDLRKNALAFLEIDDDDGKVVKNSSYVNYLAETGVQQIQESLHPFGYYRAKVDAKIVKKPKKWTVSYAVDKGKPVEIKQVDVGVTGEAESDKDFQELLAEYPLKKGDILLQEDYTDFKNKILAKALANGYFDGQFTKTQIVLADNLQSADIIVNYDSGKRYAIGKTTFKQDFLDDDVFKRYVNYEEGEVYTSKEISELQRDLYNSGYVKVIDVTAEPNKTDKVVPVELKITPKKNKRHKFIVGYGTDTGARAGYDFDWRWVNRRGHQFKSSIFASQKLLKAGAEYRIPGEHPATDYYKIFANVEKDKGGDVDSTLWNLGGAYHDKVGNLTREIGIKWQQENFTVGNDSGDVKLLTPYVDLSYRRADDILNVSDGVLVDLYVTGAHTGMLSDVSFLQAAAEAKYIKRFDETSKVTVSGGLGRTWVENFHQLPADYRFFIGGDRTIRGYSFNSIGDRDSSGANIGGDKMYYVSGEYEYFFNDDMSAAAFVDAGDVYSSGTSNIKVGAGVGFRYYSPIGPIKVDVAHGFEEPGDNVRFHLNIGPEL